MTLELVKLLDDELKMILKDYKTFVTPLYNQMYDMAIKADA